MNNQNIRSIVKLAFSLFLSLLLLAVLTAVSLAADGDEDDSVAEPTHGEDCFFLGDVDLDGTVSAADARAVLRAAVSLEGIPEDSVLYADTNGDGLISAADARDTLRVSVGLDETEQHLFDVNTIEHSTCTAGGLTEGVCLVCGKTVTLHTPANGHILDVTVLTPATCETPGEKRVTCSVCGYDEIISISATGHVWTEATLEHAQTCKLCGLMKTGWTKIGSDWVWFDETGVPPAGVRLIAGSDGTLWYCVNGVCDESARTALMYNGQRYLVLEGFASPAVSASDVTLYRAFLEVEKATTPDMTKEQKLRACFLYAMTAYRECSPRSPHYQGMDWPIVYANDMFVNGGGNCFSYAAAFAFMAKAIGYENVYGCHSGGHGWAEIDGLVYDPEWSRVSTKYSYYGLSYYDKTDVNYRGAIAAGLPWMHVKI